MLHDHGYSDVRIAALGVRADRLSHFPTHLGLHRELNERFPAGFMVSIGQQLPHKRVEVAITTLHLLREVHRIPLGLVIVGAERLQHYSAALRNLVHRLHLDNHVCFTGSVNDAELATYLRSSLCLLMTSDHEGFGIPPLEAMQELTPVIAKGVGAVPATVGAAGIVLPPKSGPCLFAESVARLTRDPDLKDQLVLAGLRQVDRLGSYDQSAEVADLLQGSLK